MTFKDALLPITSYLTRYISIGDDCNMKRRKGNNLKNLLFLCLTPVEINLNIAQKL